MSLLCEEHRDSPKSHFLRLVDEVFCVTTPEAPTFTAICRQTVDAIPPAERLREAVPGGVDIHFGHSVPNDLPGFQDNLSLRGMSLGERRFSITRETAERHLPRTATMY